MLVLLSLISCEKREEYYGIDYGYSETIGFNVIDPMTQTRNTLTTIDNEKIVNKFILRSEDGMDSLHLTQYESDINAPFNIQTRAGVFNDLSDGFFVYGYNFNNTSTATLFIDNKKATISDSKWAFSPSEYWRSGESQFFCYANAPTSGFSISTENGAPEMTYTMPSLLAGHKDIVVARSNRYPANTESVPLTFEHPLTSVEFKIGTVGMPGTINKVTISGIYTTGKLNLGHPSESFQVMGAWTYPSSKTNFSQDVQVSLTKDKNGNDIATLDNNYAFMMVPQTLEGAKLTINYTYSVTNNGQTKEKTKDLEAKLIGTWSPGKRVTYTLTTKDILDLYFNNESEIRLDAHYTMNNELSIHVGNDVTTGGTWTITSDKDWLTIKTDRTALQKEGYWIIGDEGPQSLPPQTVSGDVKVWLFAKENINVDRSAIVTLTATNDPDFKLSIPIYQMAPHWITTSEGETIGAERIEEEPTEVPWGPYWKLKTGEENYTVTYPKTSNGTAKFWFALMEISERLGWGSNNVSIPTSQMLDLILGSVNFTFDYSDFVTSVQNGTDDLKNGLENTKGGWTTKLAASSSFETYLQENLGLTPSDMNFTSEDFTQSALLSALKKNAIPKKVSDNGIEYADIDAAEINWYLPAKDETTTGVYQENIDRYACETPFGNNSTFWTSTSSSTLGKAYIYTFGGNADTEKEKNEYHRVRAIRKKD